MQKAVETEATVRPTVSFDECLSATFGKQQIDGFRSPITDEVKGAVEQYRIATFPDYLIIQLKVSINCAFFLRKELECFVRYILSELLSFFFHRNSLWQRTTL